jgi:hypothetical protein
VRHCLTGLRDSSRCGPPSNASADACDAFQFISDNIKNGQIQGRSANEVASEMIESLLLNGDLTAAKNRALAPRNGQGGGIEKTDGYVVIGGIKVPVK